MMSNTTSTLTIIRGDTYNQPLLLKVGDDPLNIAGCTIYFTVKKKSDIDTDNDTNNEIQKVITLHSNPSQGETTLLLDSTDTDIEPGDYYFDVQVVFPDNTVQSIIKQIFTIIQDVTKDA